MSVRHVRRGFSTLPPFLNIRNTLVRLLGRGGVILYAEDAEDTPRFQPVSLDNLALLSRLGRDISPREGAAAYQSVQDAAAEGETMEFGYLYPEEADHLDRHV